MDLATVSRIYQFCSMDLARILLESRFSIEYGDLLISSVDFANRSSLGLLAFFHRTRSSVLERPTPVYLTSILPCSGYSDILDFLAEIPCK